MLCPAGNYMCKINNRNTRTRCKICSKLTIKTPERRHWRRSGLFIVSFELISQLVLVFLLLTSNQSTWIHLIKEVKFGDDPLAHRDIILILYLHAFMKERCGKFLNSVNQCLVHLILFDFFQDMKEQKLTLKAQVLLVWSVRFFLNVSFFAIFSFFFFYFLCSGTGVLLE